MKHPGIYVIRCHTSQKVYVGQSVYPHGRWLRHRSTLRLGKHGNPHLQAAWNKYGEPDFTFVVIEVLSNKEDLARREAFHIQAFRSFDPDLGYNFKIENGDGYYQLSESALQRRKGRPVSPETRSKISARMIGHAVSDKAKQVLVKGRPKGIVFTAEHRDNLCKARAGRTVSAETRAKISATMKRRHEQERMG